MKKSKKKRTAQLTSFEDLFLSEEQLVLIKGGQPGGSANSLSGGSGNNCDCCSSGGSPGSGNDCNCCD